MAISAPIWTKFRSKQLKIRPGSHFQSTRLDRLDRIDSSQKMAIFAPIWTKFRSKQLKIRPGSHFQSNRLDRTDSIGPTRSDRLNRIDCKKWLPG